MQGQGNDFVVLDGVRQALPVLTPERVRALSDRHFGVGFDQLMAVTDPTNSRLPDASCVA